MHKILYGLLSLMLFLTGCKEKTIEEKQKIRIGISYYDSYDPFIMELSSRIEKQLNAYENVTVYFFPSQEDIICDLNHYADYSHYHPRYNRYMAECFVSGECLVAKDQESGKTMEEYLEDMRNIVENYDFESLREKIKQYK